MSIRTQQTQRLLEWMQTVPKSREHHAQESAAPPALLVTGTAHPPPFQNPTSGIEFSEYELAVLRLEGTPVYEEQHDSDVEPVGRVLGSWQGKNDELRVLCRITNQQACQRVLDGSWKGLALGVDAVMHKGEDGGQVGPPLSQKVREVSLCVENVYEGCVITKVAAEQS